MSLDELQRERYSRQLRLPEIGESGQERLLEAGVLLVGAGGLGSPAGLYLAAAGIGRLGVVDGDRLELSNLQRQVMHMTCRIGTPKASGAAKALRALNPDVHVTPVDAMLTPDNAQDLIADYDFVIDATDNFAAKFLVADVCHRVGRPYSHAGISRFFGQTLTVLPGRTACYRCVFGQPPETEDTEPAGPLGVVPGVVGAVQAAEAVKCILGLGNLLTDRLLTFDALEMRFREVPLKRNPRCQLCAVMED